MTRDESTEGWLPLAGGGLANVSIRKRARLSPGATGHEYIIYGQRISDQSVRLISFLILLIFRTIFNIDVLFLLLVGYFKLCHKP